MNQVNKIDWIRHQDYLQAIAQSKSTGKPILIYFNSRSCGGCNRLVDSVLNDPQLIGAVSGSVIPVWVEVENDKPDPRISELVGSHIFIMSPVLQLISSEGIFTTSSWALPCTQGWTWVIAVCITMWPVISMPKKSSRNCR